MYVLWTISSGPAPPLEWFKIIGWFHLRSQGWQYLWHFLLARGPHKCRSQLRDRSASSSDPANDNTTCFTSQTCDKSQSHVPQTLKLSLFEMNLSHNFNAPRYAISSEYVCHDFLGSLFCLTTGIYFLCSFIHLTPQRHTCQPDWWGNLPVLFIGKGTQHTVGVHKETTKMLKKKSWADVK